MANAGFGGKAVEPSTNVLHMLLTSFYGKVPGANEGVEFTRIACVGMHWMKKENACGNRRRDICHFCSLTSCKSVSIFTDIFTKVFCFKIFTLSATVLHSFRKSCSHEFIFSIKVQILVDTSSCKVRRTM